MALLTLSHLKKKYSMQVKTIVHVGAHEGQEVDDYLQVFPDVEINLFEPQNGLFKKLEDNFMSNNQIKLYNFALGSKNGKSNMYVSNNQGLSSSFFKPKEHLNEHPEVHFQLDTINFDIKILDEQKISNIDLLNIDTQGYELEVLKGSIEALSNDVRYLILEVNKKELYEGCPLVQDIDKFLKQYNFIRTDTHYWLDSYSWGDAFYIRKDLISFKKYIISYIKNTLYGNKFLYKKLINLRNFIWKIRKKTS